ncbi:hypothetical protein AYI70_g9567 [Smittium culicis]|uniref:Uncharacterized protein n=1 Tax=Smittium culicis TaxID=133412 RepID=A0A1R1XAL2_9FUNG|nr:hypothetical protein AYI70_g9567 [Smittium culicis]
MLSIRYIIAVIALSVLALYGFAESQSLQIVKINGSVQGKASEQAIENFQGNQHEEEESCEEKENLQGKESTQGIETFQGNESAQDIEKFQEKETFQGNESEKEGKESISEKDSEEFLEGKELAQGIKNILGKESGEEEESIEGKCFCLPLKRNLSYYEADECNTSCKDGYKLIDIDDIYENAENTNKIIKSNIISIPISVKSIASKICDFRFMKLKLGFFT